MRTVLWVVGIGTLAAAAIATSVSWQTGASEAEWQRVEARAAALAVGRADGERPHAPLAGATRPGEATQHYALACEEFDRSWDARFEQHVSAEEAELWDIVEMAELPSYVEDMLAQQQPALDALAAGAASDRIQIGAFRKYIEAGMENETLPVLLGGSHLTMTALIAVRHDLSRGEPKLAVQRTVDVLTLTRDQMHAEVTIYELLGVAMVNACCTVWHDDAVAKMPRSQQSELADVLMRFDAEVQAASGDARSECTLLVVAARLHAARADFGTMLTAWLTDDPAERFVEPEDLDRYFDAVEKLPPRTAPWSAREPALAALSKVIPQYHMQHAEVERMRRESLARIRMLRIAIAHHLGEPLPALADPLGDGDLQVTQRGDEIVIRSRGVTRNHERNVDEPIERIARRR